MVEKQKLNGLDELLKNDEKTTFSPAQTSRMLLNNHKKINGICKSLSVSADSYAPQRTIASIESYFNNRKGLDRILYSEISNYIFSLDVVARATFTSNAEKLLHYALEQENHVSEKCLNFVVKVYDHSQLVVYQIENVNNIFYEGIEETKVNLKKETKGIEKEYITILGIFAAIVLAFVGGITFSSSVLQNMDSVSIYRLLIVIDFLGFVLINTIYLLMKFVFVINDHDTEVFNIRDINHILGIIGISVVCAYFFMK